MMNRRTFLKTSSNIGLLCALPNLRSHALFAQSNDIEPHFFLHVFIVGGIDASYFFDARPLTFVSAKTMASYHNTPRIPYTGTNGNSCLRTDLMDNLMPWQKYFSVVNGVMMSTGFDGHPNSATYLFSNSSNGMKKSYIPIIGNALSKKLASPLESIHFGSQFGAGVQGGPNNFSLSAQLSTRDFRQIATATEDYPFTPSSNSFDRMIMERLNASRSGGVFGIGASKLADGAERSPAIAAKLKEGIAKLPQSSPTSADTPNMQNNGIPTGEEDFVTPTNLALSLFKAGMMRSATIYADYDPQIDSHTTQTASGAPAYYRKIVDNIAGVFDLLHKTPFDEAKGIMFSDVTTIVVSSEFSRTLRGRTTTIASPVSGTDHNPFTNFFLCAGKGIAGGKVIGATDGQDVVGNGKPIFSQMHLSKDKMGVQLMGKAYDYFKGQVAESEPSTFDIKNHLNASNLVNTMMYVTGVNESNFFPYENDPTSKARIITELLKGA